MERHWQGITFASAKSFSSSSRLHSTLRMPGSSHSCHRDLHCFAVFFASRDAQRDHSVIVSIAMRPGIINLRFNPYFEIAAFSTSSSTFDQAPVLVTTILATAEEWYDEVWWGVVFGVRIRRGRAARFTVAQKFGDGANILALMSR